MTVEQFLDSGIDLSWNDKIILFYEKFPPRYTVVEIPQSLNGFPYEIVEMCRDAFSQDLNHTLETLTAGMEEGKQILSLSLF